MKKLIALLLTLASMLMLCACGSTAAPADTEKAADTVIEEVVPELSAADWLNEPLTIIDNERIKIDLVDYDPTYSMGVLYTVHITKNSDISFSNIDCVIDGCTVVLLSDQCVYADKADCEGNKYSDSMQHKAMWGSYYDHMGDGDQGYIFLLVPIDAIKSSGISKPESFFFYITWTDYSANTYIVDKTDEVIIPQDYEAIELAGSEQDFEPVVLFENEDHSAKLVSVRHKVDASEYKFCRITNNGNLGTLFTICYENKTDHGIAFFPPTLREMDGQAASASVDSLLSAFGDGRVCANTKMYVTYCLKDSSGSIFEGDAPAKITASGNVTAFLGETCATLRSESASNSFCDFEADLS